jgi:Fe-S-cluster-containing dehydrogenase component/formate-dependent nitrite reductase membrane component NrfD
MTNYGFVIDNRRCIGCHACTVACKAEHDDPIGVNKTWVKQIEKGDFPNTNRNFSVMRCNHCDDSPCTDVCPVTALWEREDGIVDFDPERCIGCKACMQGCPYDALYIDPETSTAAKCNYCSHRVDSGREPACVTVCPEDAILAGDMENNDTEITQTVADQEVQARKPEKGTEPKLFYVDGDEGSITPGTTAREEHYMWSDSPSTMETQGAAREDFDLERAAESLAESDVTLSDDEGSARADGGCGCGSCECGQKSDPESERTASDGGVTKDSTVDAERKRVEESETPSAVQTEALDNDRESADEDESKTKTERAYELLHEEARRVYDINENHYLSWGWEVYSYTWTKSIAAGAILVPAMLAAMGLISVTPELIGLSAGVASVFLAITGVLLILDLEQPQRFHWVMLRPNWNSWLVKGAYMITAYAAVLGLLMAGAVVGADVVTHPAVLLVASVAAAATAVYTAFLFSQSKGRDLWQSPAMPLHMFTQAVIAGGATTGLFGLAGFDGLVGPARLVLGAGIVMHAALILSEIFTPHQTEDAEEAAVRITRGRFSREFWVGAVGVGVLLPLAVVAVGASATAVAAAGVAALVGLFAYEYCWILAPQTISLA